MSHDLVNFSPACPARHLSEPIREIGVIGGSIAWLRLSWFGLAVIMCCQPGTSSGHQQRSVSRGAEVMVRAGRLADSEALHARETGAIGERERLIFIAQHPFPGLGKKIARRRALP